METPNTRARRKRERELDDEGRTGSGVVWRQDDVFRQEFLMQTADEPLPMPAPTQRAPQLGASVSFTGNSTGTSASKRPRRVRSSLPGSVGSTAPPPPQAAATDRNRLDELLDRFLDISSRPGSAAPSSGRSASTPRTSTSSTSRTSLSSTSSASRVLADRSNAARVLAPTRSLPDVKGHAGDLRATKSAPRQLACRLAVSPAVRSSPRRAAAVAHPSPLRAPVPPPPPFHARQGTASVVPGRPGTARGAPTRTSPQTRQPAAATHRAQVPSPATTKRTTRSSAALQTPCRPTTRASAALPAQPSSDGDTSIDSLDMAFEHGGEDVERLFTLLDGGG